MKPNPYLVVAVADEAANTKPTALTVNGSSNSHPHGNSLEASVHTEHAPCRKTTTTMPTTTTTTWRNGFRRRL